MGFLLRLLGLRYKVGCRLQSGLGMHVDDDECTNAHAPPRNIPVARKDLVRGTAADKQDPRDTNAVNQSNSQSTKLCS